MSEHFDRVAEVYDRGRPPYPQQVYDALPLAPGDHVLELGAGSGLATAELVRRGARVTAVEPGPDLARLLHDRLPEVELVAGVAETAPYPHGVDLVVAATALHWLDLDVVLPRVHAALRPGGHLAAWWTVHGDRDVPTPFRDRVAEISRAGGIGDGGAVPAVLRLEQRRAELEAGGLFTTVEPLVVRWTTTLTTAGVRDLFTTFPRWPPALVDQVAAAADACGGELEEHYVTVLYLARRVDG
ncbi:class I SAM-dependent methyltransferase [Nocardioides sp.]|uniref:class I SAM-dependent methyltransferase n=1 Tax=Nocardioides sp. TaxID=35761 RepID=UPI00272032AB|nr:class I SAM-dependent methyltransferase [Nocardioides sp.]MDO9458120.1 class I SAM-dependent methyltransferase [Nocardioides sp.]